MDKDSQKSRHISQWPKLIAIYLIRGYQLLISPWLGKHCRFSPSCSQYAIEVYRHQSFLKATWLSIKRVLKCNPWHPGGVDLPPKNTQK